MAAISLWRDGLGLLPGTSSWPLFPDKEGPRILGRVSQDFGWSVTLLVRENGGLRNGRMMSSVSRLLVLKLMYSVSPQIFTKHQHVPGSVLSAKDSEQDLLG